MYLIRPLIIDFHSKKIKFLGMDIVNEFHESFLLNSAKDLHKELFSPFTKCNNSEYIKE
jgi:hypothetical protein